MKEHSLTTTTTEEGETDYKSFFPGVVGKFMSLKDTDRIDLPTMLDIGIALSKDPYMKEHGHTIPFGVDSFYRDRTNQELYSLKDFSIIRDGDKVKDVIVNLLNVKRDRMERLSLSYFTKNCSMVRSATEITYSLM